MNRSYDDFNINFERGIFIKSNGREFKLKLSSCHDSLNLMVELILLKESCPELGHDITFTFTMDLSDPIFYRDPEILNDGSLLPKNCSFINTPKHPMYLFMLEGLRIAEPAIIKGSMCYLYDKNNDLYPLYKFNAQLLQLMCPDEYQKYSDNYDRLWTEKMKKKKITDEPEHNTDNVKIKQEDNTDKRTSEKNIHFKDFKLEPKENKSDSRTTNINTSSAGQQNNRAETKIVSVNRDYQKNYNDIMNGRMYNEAIGIKSGRGYFGDAAAAHYIAQDIASGTSIKQALRNQHDVDYLSGRGKYRGVFYDEAADDEIVENEKKGMSLGQAMAYEEQKSQLIDQWSETLGDIFGNTFGV